MVGAPLECEALPQRARRERKRNRPVVAGGGGGGGEAGAWGQGEPPPAAAAEEERYHDDLETRENVHLTSGHREKPVGDYKFEYLDHTADIQLHSWGETLDEAFAQNALAMYNYMTPLKGLGLLEERTIEAEGHDMDSLLYAFLDECLFVFNTEFFVPKELTVTLDREAWTVRAAGRGETFDRTRHASGTEVKAITYSAMQVHEREGDSEIFTIVDI